MRDVIRYDMNIKEASAAPYVSVGCSRVKGCHEQSSEFYHYVANSAELLKILNGKKYIQYSENFRRNSVFQGKRKLLKNPEQ